MQAIDTNDAANSIKSQLKSLKEYQKLSSDFKKLQRDAGNSTQEANAKITEQLNKVKDLKKKFEKEAKKTVDQLLEFLTITKGNGPETFKYLRRKLLQVAVKITPEIEEILRKESLKVLGCSQEQNYVTGPMSESYIPVSSIDIFGNLKNSVTSDFGKAYYELREPNTSTEFIPYGGLRHFPMNKTLYYLMQQSNVNRNFSQIYGSAYHGKSLQPLMDIKYTTTDGNGVTGDFFKVVLIPKEDEQGIPFNTVGSFLFDYYGTIKIIDPVDIATQLTNILTGAIDMNLQTGYESLETKSKFMKIAERILGLCFDNRREIDVSGTAKVAELDGVDDSFFEINDIDLRNIEQQISNIQNRVMEFEDCDNLKLPLDFEVIMDELDDFRKKEETLTEEEKVDTLENLIDNISKNPVWSAQIPSSFNVNLSINKDLIKKLPIAIASSLISPKVLLPIYVMLYQLKNLSQNGVTNSEEFMKIFKKFNIEVISQIGAIFVRALFEELKKDILLLVNLVIKDISKSQATKKITMILSLVNIAIVVAQLISDYRKCKSILDDILNLLNLINLLARTSIPFPLLTFSNLLPGISGERATINGIEKLQGLGIPTGPMADGSPNMMGLFMMAQNKGFETEFAKNAKIDAYGLVPPLTGGYVKIFGKPV